MLFLTTICFICKVLLSIFTTADGYSVAVAGLKPTKEIIKRDCKDATFVPSYCPEIHKEAKQENDSITSYSNKTQQNFMSERRSECLGLPSDAADCKTEPGDDYANQRQIDTKYKNSKKKRKGKRRNYSSSIGRDKDKRKRSAKDFLQYNKKEKWNKGIKERQMNVAQEMETECMGLPGDALNCEVETTKAPKFTKTQKAPIFPKAHKASRSPKNPNTGYSSKSNYNDGAGEDYDLGNGEDTIYGKGHLKAAIVLKNNKLYLQFGASIEETKNLPRVLKSGEKQSDDKDYMITGGGCAWPHEFPWIVRIKGGCAVGECGGSLISPRLVLSSFHCTYNHDLVDGDRPCDHSDEKRLAYLGRHMFRENRMSSYYAIPIIDVKYPENQGFSYEDDQSHDFALLVLKEPARLSRHISPICLPKQDQDFGGEIAVAAGWGQMGSSNAKRRQSPVLRKVKLLVSTKKYNHSKMIGTMLDKNPMGEYKDACAGDSGGPLMYKSSEIGSYILIGTVIGLGYDCRLNEERELEGSINGVWNKVSAWVDWIHKQMKEMGELGCLIQRMSEIP